MKYRNRYRHNRSRRGFTPKTLLRLAALALLAWGAWLYLRDLSPPTLTLTPAEGAVSAQKSLNLHLADSGRGLASVQVVGVQGERRHLLLQRTYGPATAAAEERFTLPPQEFGEGPLTIEVEGWDRSAFPLLRGNHAQLQFSFILDNRPPEITVVTRHHNLNQGGAGLVIYQVSEQVERSGVQVGDLFFPGFRQDSGIYLCLFPFPWDMAPADFVPKVVAEDLAGNQRVTGIYYHLSPRSFPTDKIQVSHAFLENKIVPGFAPLYPEIADPVQLFLKVNRELRAQNRQTLLQVARQTASRPLWSNVFARQPNAAVPGFFAQRRTYLLDGQAIDQQTHLGIDLASTAQAEVPAANHGTVVFAGNLGIYGHCVVIDHGLGLQTLYGHLSRIRVSVGESVARGQTIANTGATGLAAGDHLHFDVLLSGWPTNPLEWWDPNWLQHNLLDKLRLAAAATEASP